MEVLFLTQLLFTNFLNIWHIEREFEYLEAF